MQNAKVFVVEDRPIQRDALKRLMPKDGHKVWLEAASLQEALDAIATGQLQALGIDLAILDSNLTEDDESGTDGRRVADAIAQTGLPIKILSVSGMRSKPGYADAYVSKGSDRSEILTAIAGL